MEPNRFYSWDVMDLRNGKKKMFKLSGNRVLFWILYSLIFIIANIIVCSQCYNYIVNEYVVNYCHVYSRADMGSIFRIQRLEYRSQNHSSLRPERYRKCSERFVRNTFLVFDFGLLIAHRAVVCEPKPNLNSEKWIRNFKFYKHSNICEI